MATTFQNVNITGTLNVNKIKIGNDSILNLTPTKKLIITTQNVHTFVDNYLVFTKVTGDYGFGMRIDKEKVQIGYGTKQQFNDHTVENALTVTPEKINVKADIDVIPSDEIDEMLQATFG